MKLNGQSIVRAPKTEVVAIVRPPSRDENGEQVDNNIYLEARAILDFSEHDRYNPAPKPPLIQKPGQDPEPNFKAPEYKAAELAQNMARSEWIVWKSLELGTNDLNWETIDPANPKTWGNWRTELEGAGLNRVEIQMVENSALIANSFDPGKMDEARNHFLATKGANHGK